jgi:hypothetical protein
MTYNIEQRWILFVKGACFQPFILQELYPRPMLDGEKIIWEKMILSRHNTSLKIRISRFPYSGIQFWANILSSQQFCHTPSSVNHLASHFPSKALYLTYRSWSPSSPWSLGPQITLHLVKWYFFHYLLATRIWITNSPIYEKKVTERKKSYKVPFLLVLDLRGLILHLEKVILLVNY